MKNVIKKVVSLLIASVMVFGMLPLTELTELDFTWISELFETKAEAASTSFLEPYKIVLRWGASPRDLDSHLEGTLSNGSKFHCYFSNKKIYDGSTLIADLDVDDTSGYGPETITISPSGLTGSYTYYIYNYTGTGSFSGAGATAELYYGDKLVETVSVPSGSGSGRYWSLFKFEDGKVRLINTVGTSVSTSSGELINTPIINEVYNVIKKELAFIDKINITIMAESKDNKNAIVSGAKVSLFLGDKEIASKYSDNNGNVNFSKQELLEKSGSSLDNITVYAEKNVGNHMYLLSDYNFGEIRLSDINENAIICLDNKQLRVDLSLAYTKKLGDHVDVESVCLEFMSKLYKMTGGRINVDQIVWKEYLAAPGVAVSGCDILAYYDGDKSCANLLGFWNGGHIWMSQTYSGGFSAEVLCHEALHYLIGVRDEYCCGYYVENNSYDLDFNGDGSINKIKYRLNGEIKDLNTYDVYWVQSDVTVKGGKRITNKQYINKYIDQNLDWLQISFEANDLTVNDVKNGDLYSVTDIEKFFESVGDNKVVGIAYSCLDDNGTYFTGNGWGYFKKPESVSSFGIMESDYDSLWLSTESTYNYLNGYDYDNRSNNPEIYTAQYYAQGKSVDKALNDFLNGKINGSGYADTSDDSITYAMQSRGYHNNSNADEETSVNVLDGYTNTDVQISNLKFEDFDGDISITCDYNADLSAWVFYRDGKKQELSFNVQENLAQFTINSQLTDIERFVVCDNKLLIYNEYFVETFSDELSDGSYISSLMTVTLDSESKDCLTIISDSTQHTNESYISIVPSFNVFESEGYESIQAQFTQTVSFDKDIDFSSIQAFRLVENEYVEIDTWISSGEHNVKYVSFDYLGEGTYVLMAKPSTETTYSPVYGLDVNTKENGFEKNVQISFVDDNDETTVAAYNIYYCDQHITDKTASNVYRTTVLPGNSKYSIFLAQNYGTVYFAVEVIGHSGGCSELSAEFEYQLLPNDVDNDGIPDYWISTYFTLSDLEDIAGTDSDDDGLTNLQEYQNGTNPINPDTDGDNVYDSVELWHELNPLEPMTDGVTDDYIVVYGIPDVAIDSDSFVVDGTTVTCTITNNTEGKAMRTHIYLYAANGDILELSTVNMNSNSSVDYTFSRDYLEEGMRIVLDEEHITRDSDYSNNEFVYVPATNIIASNPEITLVKGLTAQLEYALTPEGASKIVEWESADENIVSVNKRGLISAVRIGKTTITVTTISGYTGTYAILVEPFPGAGETDFDCRLINNNTELEIIGYYGSDENIAIPDFIGGYPVTSIADVAFEGCTFKSVLIGEGVGSISLTAFAKLSMLKDIEVAEGNPNYKTNSGVLYNSDMTQLLHYPRAKDGADFSVPETVTTIGNNAFANTLSLNAVNIPETVVTINSKAFLASSVTTVNYAGSGIAWSKVSKASDSGVANLSISYGKYTATFVAEGEAISQTDYKPGETIVKPENPTLKYYDFAGWSPEVPETMLESDSEFTAMWTLSETTRKVEYYADGELYWYDYRNAGEEITIPDSVPTKVGYTFAKWSPDIADVMPDEDLLFEAVWNANVHQVTFTADGDTHYKYECAYGEAILLPEINPTKEGYTFTGWSAVPTLMPDTDVEIVAIFEPTVYTATFTSGGETIGTDEFTIEDSVLNYPSIEAREHYAWVWDDHRIVADNIIVNGEYIPVTYTATFAADGEIVETVEFNIENQNVVAPDIPHKEGYTYAWEEYEIQLADFTVNAVYTPIVYTATFTCGEEILGTDEFTVEDKYLNYPKTPTREYYSWKWENHKIEANNLTINGGLVPIEYTVKFVAMGETVNSQTVTVENCEIVIPDVPERPGYASEWERTDYYIVLKSCTINAVYKPITYTATFTSEGKVIGTDKFTVEDDTLLYPAVLPKSHYQWIWNEHRIEPKDIIIEGGFVPVVYTVKFVSNGRIRKTQNFTIETVDTVSAPSLSLPNKAHYTLGWETYEGRLCNMTINEVYTPIKYKLSFYCQNNLVSTNWYTIENTIDQVIIPDVPNVPGYEVVWPSFKFTYKEAEVRVEAVLTPIEYTAQFVADGNVISTQTFTVESEGLVEPYIPQKAGYIASWSYYTISAGDKVITAKYRLPEVLMQARRTLAIHETYRLLPMANFTADEKVWTSSDTSVATVDQNGKVTALTDGECIITVTFYGKDSLGNDIQATATTKILVEGEKSSAPKTFRELFDEFFKVTLYEILFNFREFLITFFKYAY